MSEMKVTDRRWWARGEQDAVEAEEPKLKPAYVEELEARLVAKDAELLTGTNLAAEDIAQEAFLSAFRALPLYDSPLLIAVSTA